jgi:uncharacterized protein YcfJ
MVNSKGEMTVNAYQFGGALLVATAIALPASANEMYYDNARVVSVFPQTERVNLPRQECRTEYVPDGYYRSGDRDISGSIVGGIAGGLLGSQIGKGKGRIAGAAVGAATGAIVGDRISNDDRRDIGYSTRPVERCVQVDNWQTVNRGYLVTYRYNGRDYTTTMATPPGAYINVQVGLAPPPGYMVYPGNAYPGAVYPGNVIAYAPGYAVRGDGWHREWDRDQRWHDHDYDRDHRR